MKFLTFAFVINFILVCWPKLDIISKVIIGTSQTFKNRKFCKLSHDVPVKRLFGV